MSDSETKQRLDTATHMLCEVLAILEEQMWTMESVGVSEETRVWWEEYKRNAERAGMLESFEKGADRGRLPQGLLSEMRTAIKREGAPPMSARLCSKCSRKCVFTEHPDGDGSLLKTCPSCDLELSQVEINDFWNMIRAAEQLEDLDTRKLH